MSVTTDPLRRTRDYLYGHRAIASMPVHELTAVRDEVSRAERILAALYPVVKGLEAGDTIGTALTEWTEERDRADLETALRELL